MARGMILFIATILSSSAMALSQDDECASRADRLVAVRYADASITRQEFTNTTAGSYDQEYTGVYLVDGQTVVVEFYSPFICESLRVTSVSN